MSSRLEYLDRARDLAECEDLTETEASFVSVMVSRLEGGANPSESQCDRLDRLHEKYCQ